MQTAVIAQLKSGNQTQISGYEGVDLVSADIQAAKGGLLESKNGKVTSDVIYLNTIAETKGEAYKLSQKITGVANKFQSAEGGDLLIEAKNGIELTGVKLKTTGDVQLTTETGNILTKGITNSNYDLYHHEWETSSWFVLKTKHVEHQEKYEEKIDRTEIEANHYVAKSGDKVLGTQGDVLKEGTTIKAATIYEAGKDKKELATNITTLVDNNSSSSTGLDLGILKIGDLHKVTDSLKTRGVTKEVNENTSTGAQLSEFEGETLLQGSKLKSEQGKITFAGDGNVKLQAVKNSYEVEKIHSESGFSGIDLSIDLSKLKTSSSTSYKGTTDISKTYDETANGVDIQAGNGIVFANKGTLTGDGANLDSGLGKLVLGAKGGTKLVEADEIHTASTSHSDDTIKVTSYVANKWAEAAASAVDSAKKGKVVDAAATAGSTVKTVADSAASAATFGFYVGVSTEHDKDITESGTKTIVRKGSTLTSAGGMDLGVAEADFDMTGGSITNSGGDLRLIGDKVTLLGSTDTQISTFDNAHENQSLDLQTNIVGYYNATATAAQSGAKQAASTKQVNNLMITNSGTTTLNHQLS